MRLVTTLLCACLLIAGAPRAVGGNASLLVFRASASKTSLLNPETGAALSAPFLAGFDACHGKRRPWLRRRYGPLPQPRKKTGEWTAAWPTREVRDLSLFRAKRAAPLDLVLPLSAEVAEWTRHANVASPVLLHVFNASEGGRYVTWVHAWAWHAQRVGVLKHALFVSLTAEGCFEVSTLAPCLVHHDFGTPLKASDAARVRWLYAWLLVQAKMDVIVLDADAFLLENPMPVLAAQPSRVLVQGLSDQRGNHKHLPYCDVEGAPCQSTGFTFIRSRGVTKRLLTKFIAQLRNESTWEQVIGGEA
jgi:hypothetical protein